MKVNILLLNLYFGMCVRESPFPCRGADVFVVEASQVTEMLEANVIAPYKFRKVSNPHFIQRGEAEHP